MRIAASVLSHSDIANNYKNRIIRKGKHRLVIFAVYFLLIDCSLNHQQMEKSTNIV